MNSHFNLIKQRISLLDACRVYGINLNRYNKAVCPFHKEKTASFSIKGQIWSCFGCGLSGDVISLVQRLYNISHLEALGRLNSDFRIGLDLDYKPDRKAIIKARQDAELKEQFERWVKNSFDILLREFRELHFASKDTKHPLFCESLQEKEKIDYYINCLEENPLAFYKANKEAVKKIERRRIERSRVQAI